MFLLAQCNSDDAHKAIIYLVLIGVASGAVKSGYNVNQIDLSPNFAGVLMGICNGLSAAVSSLGPMVVYVVVTNEVSLSSRSRRIQDIHSRKKKRKILLHVHLKSRSINSF